ncbi:MAG: hypothetical protein A2945_04070 [Candidatus Liptonbacteria bacterium RIFCSPLOWO2_01_FULL_52_25]|uniref:Ig-like domain-containing protein n=1 Tax=Candidatus Liptonbacteria bacterium RIFCSPLOWO2_01_FULL_52_25 TaxID=1798650 RepID=A0A1G2CC81_9BACT|nr:MAG: hypothetical protein A2945_04070 [Candidatus Liptonbacteria bacterium RIFCSPLOWO2_01_FULL_52_25]
MFVPLLFALGFTGCADAGGGNSGGGGGGGDRVPPSIMTQPASQTVTVGKAATFTVVATGTPPLGYQWQKDGAAIPWATSASYTTPLTTIADTGSQFRVVVSNAAGSATSAPATLTVNAAPVPCEVTSVVISPRDVTLTEGESQPFSAALHFTGPCNEGVLWSANLGTISSQGLYTAPEVDSTTEARVEVRSVADPSKSDAATVTIEPRVIPNPTPTISTTRPTVVVPPRGSDWVVTVIGANFVSGSAVQVNGGIRTTTFVSPTELLANMPAIDAATPGELAITVVNSDGAASNTAIVIVDTTVSVARIPTLKLTDPNPKNLLGAKVKAVDGVFGDGKKAVAVAAANGVYLLHDPDSHLGSFTVSQVGSALLPGVKFFYGGPVGIGVAFYNIARAGDLDNDGTEDFLVSMVTATDDPTNKPAAGIVFAVPGGPALRNYAQIDLNSPPADVKVVAIRGTRKFHFAGHSMADGMDFDLDGFSDIAFSAPLAGEVSIGEGSIFGGPGGVIYLIYGRLHFFDLGSIDLLRAPQAGDAAFVRRTTSSGYFLGSAFPGADTIQFVPGRNNDKFPKLIIGDPFSENGAFDRQKAYVVFSAPLRGTFFISDVGVLYAGVTFVADQRNACHFGDPQPCYSAFGTTVAGGDHSLMITSPGQGVLGSTLTNGTVFIWEQPLTSGQVIDVIAAVQSQQATSLWDMNSAWFDQMGLRVVDGPDIRLISFPGFDENRGKLLFVPASGIARGNLDVVPVTIFTLTGENRKDLFSHSLARAEDGSILVGARSFTNANPGTFYYVPAGSILW